MFRIAVDAIVPNDDFAWSAFANEIALLNPDDLVERVREKLDSVCSHVT